jgi:hypothetical protein
LRDGILYIHPHSQLAAHASWVDMESMIHEAGYTWKGLGNSCKQTTKRCMDCLKAKRPHSKAAGLLSSRRYRCPFDSLSWDMQDLGKAATTTHEDNRYLLTMNIPRASSPPTSGSTPYLTRRPRALPTASLTSPSVGTLRPASGQATMRKSRTKWCSECAPI